MQKFQLLARFLTPGLAHFRDRHKGETCYVLGDGPSIKRFDLGRLSGHPAFCCGLLPFHRDFEKLDVRWISLVEPWFFAPRTFQSTDVRAITAVVREYRQLILSRRDKHFFINLSNRPWFSPPNVTHVWRGLPVMRNENDRRLGGIDLFAGSFHASVTLAYYMGFTKVILAGFDAWTLNPIRNIRWYEYGPGEVHGSPGGRAMDFLEIIGRQTEICVLGSDGESPNVTYLDYEQHTGVAPRYEENTALMKEHHLRMLDGVPSFRIRPDDGAPER
jgi:hypothetical protein